MYYLWIKQIPYVSSNALSVCFFLYLNYLRYFSLSLKSIYFTLYINPKFELIFPDFDHEFLVLTKIWFPDNQQNKIKTNTNTVFRNDIIL